MRLPTVNSLQQEELDNMIASGGKQAGDVEMNALQSVWPTTAAGYTASLLSTGTTSSVTRPIPSPLQSPSAVEMGFDNYWDSSTVMHSTAANQDDYPVAGQLTTTMQQRINDCGGPAASYRNFGNGLHFCDTSIGVRSVTPYRNNIAPSTAIRLDNGEIDARTLDHVDDRLLLHLIEDFGLLQQTKEELPDLGAGALLPHDTLPWRSTTPLMMV